jgi:aldehyde:ferredoxin oxidoreductase
LIGLQETGGIELSFGNAAAMLEMIELIAKRQGFGELLSKGSRCAAQAIGQGSMDFTMQVKGEEMAMHDPRGKVGVGLGYATSEIGADHLVTIHDPSLSNPDSFSFKSAKLISDQIVPLPPTDLSDQKVAQYWLMENWVSCGKTIGLCFFGPAPRSYMLAPDVLEAVRSATGWEVTVEELLKIGERGTNLARLFNLREGFTPADDTLPARLFTPLENGPLAGKALSRDEFDRALRTLYRLKSWDLKTGMPSMQRLRELDISWAMELFGEE